MDFELTEDQVDLQAGIRNLLEGRFPIETVRSFEGTAGVDRGLWKELADAGVFTVALPEDQGGVGLGWADTTLVYEELGRAVVPGPVVGATLLAPYLEGVGTGDVVAGLVEESTDGLAATRIENFDALDKVVVLRSDGLWVVDAADVSTEELPKPLDPLTSMHRITNLPAGELVADAEAAQAVRLRGALLVASLQLGLAEIALELAVAYAKERQQFNRPIGSFQAVKHICADMATRVEVSRSAVYAAGVTMDDPAVGDPVRAVHVAKITAGEAAVENGKGCIQVHGGMGYTWEVDAHLYLKRAWLLDTVFGDPAHHAEALALSL